MAIVPDPRNANVIYMAQNNGNTSRLDLRTYARTEMQPTQQSAKGLGLSPLRWDWSPPLILDVSNPDILYVGSQYTSLPLRGIESHTGRLCGSSLCADQRRPEPPTESPLPSGRRGLSQLWGIVLPRPVHSRSQRALGRGRRWLDTRVTRPR